MVCFTACGTEVYSRSFPPRFHSDLKEGETKARTQVTWFRSKPSMLGSGKGYQAWEHVEQCLTKNPCCLLGHLLLKEPRSTLASGSTDVLTPCDRREMHVLFQLRQPTPWTACVQGVESRREQLRVINAQVFIISPGREPAYPPSLPHSGKKQLLFPPSLSSFPIKRL